MSVHQMTTSKLSNLPFYDERVDLAAAFRWAVKNNWHEAVANHFSLAVNDEGTQFLINPNGAHFSRIKASDLLMLDANDSDTLSLPNAPDVTAWGLHGSIHRHCPHARCVLHVHSVYATVLAGLEDSNILPIDQNTASFYNRYVIDEHYGGLAMEEEGTKCAGLLNDPKKQVMIMGNHGVLVIGENVADAFTRLYYFERAAETYVKALWTGKALRVLSDEIAEKTASQMEDYGDFSLKHFNELKAILDEEGSNYRD